MIIWKKKKKKLNKINCHHKPKQRDTHVSQANIITGGTDSFKFHPSVIEYKTPERFRLDVKPISRYFTFAEGSAGTEV